MARTGGPSRVLRRGVGHSAWLGRGDRIAVGSHRRGVAVLDHSGRVLRRHRGVQPLPSARGELAVLRNPFGWWRNTIDVYTRSGRRRAVLRATAAAWRPDGRVLAYVRNGGVWLLPESGRPSRIVRGRVDAGGVAWSPDGRHVLYRSPSPMLVRPGARPRRSRFDVVSAAWSRDGRIALAQGSRLVLARPLAARPSAVVDRSRADACWAGFASPTWLPHGRLLYVRTRGGLNAADLWTDSPTPAAPRRLVGTRSTWESAPVWSPNGDLIAYESRSVITSGGRCEPMPDWSSIRVVAANGTGRDVSPAGPTATTTPRPCGHRTARASRSRARTSRRRRIGSASTSRTWPPAARPASRSPVRSRPSPPAARRPGRRTDVCSPSSGQAERGSAVWIVAANGSGVRRLTSGGQPQWSPRAEVLAFVRARGVFTIRADGSGERRVATLDAPPANAPRWSPDGSSLAVAAGRSLITIDVSAGTSRRLASSFGGVSDPAWSPDGRWIAYVGRLLYLRSELYVAQARGRRRVVRVTRDLALVDSPRLASAVSPDRRGPESAAATCRRPQCAARGSRPGEAPRRTVGAAAGQRKHLEVADAVERRAARRDELAAPLARHGEAGALEPVLLLRRAPVVARPAVREHGGQAGAAGVPLPGRPASTVPCHSQSSPSALVA